MSGPGDVTSRGRHAGAGDGSPPRPVRAGRRGWLPITRRRPQEAPLRQERRSPTWGSARQLHPPGPASRRCGSQSASEIRTTTEPTIHQTASGGPVRPRSGASDTGRHAAGTPPQFTPSAWLQTVSEDAALATMRPVRRRTILAVAAEMARVADWRGRATRPTRAGSAAAAGICERTVSRAWRWIEHRGYAVVTEPGTTPRFRPAILREGQEGNLARTWLLIIPAAPGPLAVHEAVTPPRSFRRHPSARARERARFGPPLRSGLPHRPAGMPGSDGQADTHVRTKPKPAPTGQGPTRGAMLSAAEWLRRQSATLRRISARMLRHLLRPFWRRSWTVRDVLHALDFTPAGEPHICTDAVRDAAGWVRWRLSRWLSRDGLPRRPHSQQLAGLDALRRAAQESRRREHAQAAELAASVDVGKRAAELRAIVSERLRTAPRPRE